MSEDPFAKRPADDGDEPTTPAYGTPPPPPVGYHPYTGSAPEPGYGQPPTVGFPAGAYGYGPTAFGVDPVTGIPYSDKSKVVAGLLQLLLPFVGIPGVGRLYAGHVAIGVIQLVGAILSWFAICLLIGFFTLPAFLLWSFVDGIIMLTAASPRDGQGRVLRP